MDTETLFIIILVMVIAFLFGVGTGCDFKEADMLAEMERYGCIRIDGTNYILEEVSYDK